MVSAGPSKVLWSTFWTTFPRSMYLKPTPAELPCSGRSSLDGTQSSTLDGGISARAAAVLSSGVPWIVVESWAVAAGVAGVAWRR